MSYFINLRRLDLEVYLFWQRGELCMPCAFISAIPCDMLCNDCKIDDNINRKLKYVLGIMTIIL